MASAEVKAQSVVNAPVVSAQGSRLTLRQKEAIAGYIFILPAVLGFILWTAGPMLYSLWLSFHSWNLIQPPKWIGLGNFREMWNDRVFWASVRATLTYAAILVPLFQILAFSAALLLNTKTPGISFFRAAFYLPVVVPVAAASFLWQFIFNSEFGLLNYLLGKIGIGKIFWFQEPRFAMSAMIVMSLWLFGGTMVIYLAALQGVPEHLHEAAALDGASALRRLFVVTIPMMSPVIFFNCVLGVIGALQIFTQAFIITGGGPQHSTRFFSYFVYIRGFRDFKMGYASALSWVLFAFILLISLLIFRTLGRMVYYEEEGR
ncbi:MAG: sugar ABC transporter permease [Thermomicrobiales bacterium]|nr:sugar ABC transporter permease [Thermomicrobiales bacterium]